MCKFTKMLGTSFACMFVLSVVSTVNAADTSRLSTGAGRASRATQTARMPSMPVLPINAMGNTTVDTDNQSGSVVPPQPDNPQPDNPQPDNPQPECPDGGVRNSDYAVADCMNDVLSCVNNGALPNGLNDLFSEDVRNAILNGMGLCSVQVDKCMVSVRRDCKPVYRSMADVWVDFNSRKVQPEYYNFVLRKTGLTPNQAENTCRLLDKNTYGPSFAAVANDGRTTAEYNNQVGAYNGQMGNVLIKSNPQGVAVNDGNPGVDGARGHYARWDATTATCLIRVAAYNKDKQIKNSWLFGALGNDEAAEVWQPAGETFSCNKDLFGFSLMKDTNTAAVVGVGGGTLLGAGIGALAGHGKRLFDCNNEKHRQLLMEQIQGDGTMRTINQYLFEPIAAGTTTVSVNTCLEIVNLYDKNERLADALKACNAWGVDSVDLEASISASINCNGYSNLDACFKTLPIAQDCVGKNFTTVDACVAYLNENKGAELEKQFDSQYADANAANKNCRFKSFRVATADDILCDGTTAGCVGPQEIERDMNALNRVFGDKDAAKTGSLAYLIVNGEKSNMARSIGTGAAIGAGTGGVATAITALVERNNINCRVGDGLNTVAFGKSHSIDTLKDFYVKWNLRLPDTVMPTASAVDCKSWKLSCAQYTDLEQCKAAAINYKPNIDGTITLVRSACAVSGSVCIENAAVAQSYGACIE